jgi:hypothetical protein
MILYLDESGDLGFSTGSSSHFIIGFLATDSEVALKRRIKRVKERFGLPPDVEAKAADSDFNLRRAMLQAVQASGAEVHVITVYKAHVHKRLRENTNILYNYAASLLLLPLLKAKSLDAATLVVDQRIIRVPGGRLPFDDYIRTELWGTHGTYTDLRIHHVDSRQSYGLQAADFVTNALFRARERGDWSLWNLIRDGVATSRKLFEGGETEQPT